LKLQWNTAWAAVPLSALKRVFTQQHCRLVYTAERIFAVVILSVRLSLPGTESSPGEIETPGFYCMVA